jgi:hypothetical protein
MCSVARFVVKEIRFVYSSLCQHYKYLTKNKIPIIKSLVPESGSSKQLMLISSPDTIWKQLNHLSVLSQHHFNVTLPLNNKPAFPRTRLVSRLADVLN